MNREAIVAIAFVGAFVLWASSGSAQVPCKNPQSIGCDVDPNTGRFIERGSAPRPPTNEAQPREPARAPTAPQRPMTEQDRRDMERARALDQRREAEEARFKAYVADCQTANRLGQPECLAASEWLKSEA